jgi:hypothetical protein
MVFNAKTSFLKQKYALLNDVFLMKVCCLKAKVCFILLPDKYGHAFMQMRKETIRT